MQNTIDTTAVRITPESLRAVLAAVPELGEYHINEVLGGFLVLNMPRYNKDGSISKKPPIKWVILSPEFFNEKFKFAAPQEKRRFVGVIAL